MKDKKMNIYEEKWIKTIIKTYIRTNSIPPEYWLDKIEKKYGVKRDLFFKLLDEVRCVLWDWCILISLMLDIIGTTKQNLQ